MGALAELEPGLRAEMTCPRGHTGHAADARFCSVCGKPLGFEPLGGPVRSLDSSLPGLSAIRSLRYRSKRLRNGRSER